MTETERRKLATRWKCRSCGQSALFVVEGSATVQNLVGWVSRETGYKSLVKEPLVVKTEFEDRRPDYCWVCGSDDIGHARLTEGELGNSKHRVNAVRKRDIQEERRDEVGDPL